MTPPAWHAEARRLRGEGYSYDAIAILLGRSKAGVRRVINRDRFRANDAAYRARNKAVLAEKKAARLRRKRATDPGWRERDKRRKVWQRIERKKIRYIALGILKPTEASVT